MGEHADQVYQRGPGVRALETGIHLGMLISTFRTYGPAGHRGAVRGGRARVWGGMKFTCHLPELDLLAGQVLVLANLLEPVPGGGGGHTPQAVVTSTALGPPPFTLPPRPSRQAPVGPGRLRQEAAAVRQQPDVCFTKSGRLN